MVYTSTNILNSVKRNQTISSSTFRFQDSDLLSMVDEEIENTIVPMILRLHSDRLIYTENLTLSANTSTYAIPYRAIGGQLRELLLQDSTIPTWKKNLSYYEFEYGILSTQTGTPTGFYFSGDNVVLVPNIGSTSPGVLNISYHIKHPRLVLSSAVAVISSVNYTTGVITFTTNVPTSWATSSYYDFLVSNDRSKPRIAKFDIQSSLISTNTMTFVTSDIPIGLVSGDRVVLAQQSDVLLLPDECYKYLCKAVEIKIMEAQKDLNALQAISPKLNQAREAMESILTPRIIGETRPIVNRGGLLSRRFGPRSAPNIVID